MNGGRPALLPTRGTQPATPLPVASLRLEVVAQHASLGAIGPAIGLTPEKHSWSLIAAIDDRGVAGLRGG